jgi:threonine/homoserine/homoserine lactone efflux protein
MGWGSWGGGYNPSPPASDGAISSISYPSHLTVLLNSIIIFFFSSFFMPGVRPNAPMVDLRLKVGLMIKLILAVLVK